VLVTELRGVLRDRRALFAGVVLPALLYPLFFLGQGWLQRVAEETLEAKEVHLALELSALDAPVRERALALLAREVPIVLDELPPGACAELEAAVQEGSAEAAQRERDLAEALLGPEGDLVLHGFPDPLAPANSLFRLHFDGARDEAREAADRVGDALDTLFDELRAARLDEDLGGDPAAQLVAETRDLASDEDRGGALLGRLLPLIAILVLVSGGSFAALSAFAGERESGTLETLLVQPVRGLEVVRGKFLAVLATSFGTLGLNTLSLFACLVLGVAAPGEATAGAAALGPARVLLGALLLAPVALLATSALCFVCGRARSFREGQNYLLPLTLLTMLPAALALSPEVELDPLLALVPIAGPSLAVREALSGDLRLLPGALAVLSTLGYAGLLLRGLGDLLDGERALGDSRTPEERLARMGQSRSALTWGWAGVFAVYLVGGLLQGLHPLYGLMATLWLLLPAGAVIAARGTARRAEEPLGAALGLGLPRPWHALAALLAAPALMRLAMHWVAWQQEVLPLPSRLGDAGGLAAELTSLPPAMLFLALALSPGICEELFFRGAVLSGLRRDLSPWRTVLWQALLFGAVHASLHRFVPTAVLGGLLATLTLRSRSLWPAVLLHTAYNGSVVLSGDLPWLEADWVPWLGAPALLLALLPGRRDWR
jgi:membrane protease YdiL (CAAX protease family)